MNRILTAAALTLGLLLGATSSAPAIVGGEPVKGEFPFFAQLINESNSGSQCGASLVRAQWVLTAAHCVSGDSVAETKLIFDSKRRREGPRVGVTRFIVHPGFSEESLPLVKAAWDVAVVQLERPLDRPVVRFAAPEQFRPGTPSTTIGFGADAYLVGSYRDDLYQAEHPIVDDTSCKTANPAVEAEQHICAGTFENEDAACQGDSGGPLMVREPATQEWLLVGTVSFGVGCGTPGTYNVFSRAAGPALREWIERNLPPLPAAVPAAPAPRPTGSAPAVGPRIAFAAPTRRGARSVQVRVNGSGTVVARDARGELGRTRARRAGTLRVALRRPLRAGRLVVSLGSARAVRRVR